METTISEMNQFVNNNKAQLPVWKIIKSAASTTDNEQPLRPARYDKGNQVQLTFSNNPFTVLDICCVEGGYVYFVEDAQDCLCKLITTEDSIK